MSNYFSRDRLVFEMLTRILVKIGDEKDIRWMLKHIPEAKPLVAHKDAKTQHEAAENQDVAETLTFSTVENILTQWIRDSRAHAPNWTGSPLALINLLTQQKRLPLGYSVQQMRTVIGKVISQSTKIPALVRAEIDEQRQRVWVFEFIKDE